MAKLRALSSFAFLLALIVSRQALAEPVDSASETNNAKLAQAIEDLRSDNADVAQQAEHELINFSDQAIPALQALRREDNPLVAERVKGTLAKIVARHIQTLASESNRLADAAETSLVKLKYLAVPQLQDVVQNGDPKPKARATRVLDKILFHTHVVRDALGEPIPGAALKVTVAFLTAPDQPDGSLQLEVVSDERGHVVLELPAQLTTGVVRMRHAEYGVAELRISQDDVVGDLRFSLVKAGSESRAQALRGIVMSSDGKPVAGATLQIFSLLPQENSLTMVLTDHVALTDDAGRFALYPVRKPQGDQPLQPLPKRIKARLRVSVMSDNSLFPQIAECSSAKEVVIRLERPERFHKFEFADLNGGWLKADSGLHNIHIHYRAKPGGLLTPLDVSWVFHGAKLLPGYYEASYQAHDYVPLHVTAESPEDLKFQFPKPIAIRGRVINGVSGEPMAGAFVLGIVSSGKQSLARLTDDDWERLRKLPADAAPNDPALAFVAQCFGLAAFGRTDESGKYEIIQKPEQNIYGVVAVDKDFLPILQPKYGMKIGEETAEVPDLPLFPAGKVMIHPICAKRASIMPVWKIRQEGRPEWFKQFEDATNLKLQRRFQHDNWMQPVLQPVYIPADMDLQIELKAPYEEQWSATTSTNAIRVKQGETRTIGEMTLLPAVEVEVEVVDADGKPLAGALLSRDYDDRHYGKSHPTDANGRAKFHLNRNSHGAFVVLRKELGGIPKRDKDPNMFASFEVGTETPPGQPYRIQLTAEQVRRLTKKVD